MTPSRSPLRGLLVALLAAALFGVNGTVSKVALEGGISSLRLVEMRSVGSGALLLLVVALVRPRSLRVTRGELGFLVMAGIVGIALVQWFYFVAIARLPVGIALLVEYLAPVMVVLWVRFVRREAVHTRMWAALALAVVGLAVVAQVWKGLTLDGIGLLAGLAAAAALAAYYLTGERGLANRDELSLAAYIFVAAGLFWSAVQPWWTFPFAVLGTPVVLPGPLEGTIAPMWALVAWITVLGTVVPYVLVLVALRSLGSARTGLAGMTEPVLAALVAWTVLGERLTWVQLLGGVVVLSGIVLAETSRTRRRPPDEVTGEEPPVPVPAAGMLPEGMAP